MADIFLSYSHFDRSKAREVVAALEEAGYSVFWDQATPSGSDWNTWIRDQLTQARLCVTLWSKTSVNSRNVIHESTIALEEGKFLPVMINNLRAEQFPMGFYTTQAVDSRGRSATSLARILNAVRARLPGDSGGVPPETPAVASVHVLYPQRRSRGGVMTAQTATASLQTVAPAIAGVLAAYALLAGAGYAPSAMADIGSYFSAEAHAMAEIR